MVESTGPGDGMSYFVDNDNCLLSYAVGKGYSIWSPPAKAWKPYYPARDPMTESHAVDEAEAKSIMDNPDYAFGPVAELEVVGVPPGEPVDAPAPE